MSSQQRSSSSGVRDLRAMFEKRDTGDSAVVDSPDRGRSPSSASVRAPSAGPPDKSPAPSSRKIRANFVSVDGTGGPVDDKTSSGSMANRRPSISLDQQQDKETLLELKKTVSNEYDRRKSIPHLPETVPEQAAVSALPTPIPDDSKRLGEQPSPNKPVLIPTRDKQSEHPEKSVSAVEDSATLKPADVKDRGAISDGKALDSKTGPKKTPASAMHPSKGKTTVPKPPTLSTTRRSQEASTLKSPPVTKASPKSPRSSLPTGSTTGKAPVSRKSSGAQPARPRSPTRPVRLPSHLTAPTAASAAKHEPEQKKQPTALSRKPVELPSRLVAPTASSKAKHEEAPQLTGPAAPTKKPARASFTPRSSIGSVSTTARKAPGGGGRQSMVSTTSTNGPRNVSNTSTAQPSHKKPTQASEGFLARMMKPTAASIKKHQDESQPNSPTHKHDPGPSDVRGADGKTEAIKATASGVANAANAVKSITKPQVNGDHKKSSRPGEANENATKTKQEKSLRHMPAKPKTGITQGPESRRSITNQKQTAEKKSPKTTNPTTPTKPTGSAAAKDQPARKIPPSSTMPAEAKFEETKPSTETSTPAERGHGETKPSTQEPTPKGSESTMPELPTDSTSTTPTTNNNNGMVSNPQETTGAAGESKSVPSDQTPVQNMILDGAADTPNAPFASTEQSKPNLEHTSNGDLAPETHNLPELITPTPASESKSLEPSKPSTEQPTASTAEPKTSTTPAIEDVGETY